MCNCCFESCGWLGRMCSSHKLSDEEKLLRDKHSRKLLSSLAILSVIIKTSESLVWLLLYSACVVFYKRTLFFNILAFGDCNGPLLYFYLVIIYLGVQTVLGAVCIFGFWKQHWKLIVPFLALRACFVVYNLFNIMYDNDGLNFYEVSCNFFAFLTMVFTWLIIMIAYLQMYGDTEPIDTFILYDET